MDPAQACLSTIRRALMMSGITISFFQLDLHVKELPTGRP